MKKILFLVIGFFAAIKSAIQDLARDIRPFAFMALQGQSAFDEGTFTFDGSSYGIIDISLGEESSEIDVSDTETTSGESEFLSGKTSRAISFTAFHKFGTATLPTKIDKLFSMIAVDEAGNTTTFSGTCKLMSKEITGSRDGAFQVAYSGRIQGAMAEVHSS